MKSFTLKVSSYDAAEALVAKLLGPDFVVVRTSATSYPSELTIEVTTAEQLNAEALAAADNSI